MKSEALVWRHNDGGRAASGMKGTARDCTVRAWAIATGRPYLEVYDRLFELNREFAKGHSKAAKKTRKNPSPRNGVFRAVVDQYAAEVGFRWVPTMQIGAGCKTHLRADELPSGRIVCSVSRHYVAVIDGVIQDTYDASRGGTRCVYGYYQPESEEPLEETPEEPTEETYDDDGLGLDRLVNDAAIAADSLRRTIDAAETLLEVLESVATRLEGAVKNADEKAGR